MEYEEIVDLSEDESPPNEVCLSVASRTTHSGTISVSPYIKIWNHQRYKDLDVGTQKQVIEYEIRSHLGIKDIASKGILYYFELTERGNIHCHLLFTGWEEQSMRAFQTKMSIKFGYAKDPIDRAFYYEKTHTNIKFWERYILKDQ